MNGSHKVQHPLFYLLSLRLIIINAGVILCVLLIRMYRHLGDIKIYVRVGKAVKYITSRLDDPVLFFRHKIIFNKIKINNLRFKGLTVICIISLIKN